MTAGAALVRDERGYATVAAAGVIAGLAATLVLVIYVGAAVLARHRAQSAADLAALAAAVQHVAAQPDPCLAAQEVTRAQRPEVILTRCRITGEDVVVTVRAPVSLGALGQRYATADARAGPVE